MTALVLVSYARVWAAGFVWDDDAHVTSAALRSWHGLARIWFEPGATQQYYPLLHSLFWFEWHLWGDASTGYHVANLVLHSSAAILLALTLRRLGVKGAWVAAAIFAVHPVMVESVAWISEQKNTLSAVLYFGSALAYFRFDSDRRKGLYLLATVLFIAALAAKTVTATLPAALLVVFWWQRGRLSLRRDVLSLLPWFALSVLAGLTTAWMERTSIGASGDAFAIGGVKRFLIAGRAVWFYFGKLLVPANLIFVYPRWEISRAVWTDYLPVVGFLAVLGITWRLRDRTRSPLTVALLYVGTLFPALGFIDVFPFQYSFVADHFQYLAAALLISAFVGSLNKIDWSRFGLTRPLRLGFVAAVLAALAVLTCQQTAGYENADTLWRTTLARNPDCWMAGNNLAADLLQSGRLDEALPLIESSVRLAPHNVAGRLNLGQARLLQGRVPDAISEFQHALEVAPDNGEAHADLAGALLASGQASEAELHANRAVALRPDSATSWTTRGNVSLAAGQLDSALSDFERAVMLDASDNAARTNQGITLARLGRVAEAVTVLNFAVSRDPHNANAQLNLANALLQSGRAADALPHFHLAQMLNPHSATSHVNEGLALMRLDRATDAEIAFRAALAIDPHDREAHRNLGAILYRRGDLDEARRHLEEAGPLR